jgi:GH25 family lysozyme M1 (1,4-beta-N-acetylmuramidase)
MRFARDTANLTRRQFRQMVFMLTAVAVLTNLPGAAFAEVCSNGAEVDNQKRCSFFVKRSDPAIATIDDRISALIPAHDALDPPVRSFALVVSVHSYPHFSDSKDQVLAPAKADLDNLLVFLTQQKFDEIIVLEDANATKENITYFLDSYLNKALDTYRMRSRVVFAFTGHGAPPDRPGKSGSLILGGAMNSSDYPNMFKLDELAPLLKKIGEKSYHFVALMGSCFSGGIFPPTNQYGDNSFYPRAPGAHAMSATKADDLAYAFTNKPGTIFFNQLIDGVTSGRGDRDYSGWAEDAAGNLHLVGGGIVRSGALASYVSGAIDHLGRNPDTGVAFPQLRFGRLTDSEDSGGAFFFLGPDKKDTITVAQGPDIYKSGPDIDKSGAAPLPPVTLSLGGPAAASSIVSHPEVKLFNPPYTYPVQGIDISHYDGEINWPELAKRSNFRFAYMKATEGSTYVDKTFERNWKQSKDAGLIRGAYHVFSFCKSAAGQFDLVKKIVPKDESALPIAIDVQWINGPIIPGEEKCNDIPTATKSLSDLERMLRDAYGKRPVIHGFTSTFKDIVREGFGSNTIWLQDYKKTPNQTGPSLPGKNPWSIWQFSSNAVLPGINGHVDVNAFFGTDRQFQRFVTSGDNVASQAAQQLERVQ